jgi:hypothetical protein
VSSVSVSGFSSSSLQEAKAVAKEVAIIADKNNARSFLLLSLELVAI